MFTFEDACLDVEGKTLDHWDHVFLDVCHACDLIDMLRMFDGPLSFG
jgi:hypothetical protein